MSIRNGVAVSSNDASDVDDWPGFLERALEPIRSHERPFAMLARRLSDGWYDDAIAAVSTMAVTCEVTDLNYGRCRHLLLPSVGCQVCFSLWARVGVVLPRVDTDMPLPDHVHALEAVLEAHDVRVIPPSVLMSPFPDVEHGDDGTTIWEVFFQEA